MDEHRPQDSPGIPVVQDDEFAEAAAEHRGRRRRLDALVDAGAGPCPSIQPQTTGDRKPRSRRRR